MSYGRWSVSAAPKWWCKEVSNVTDLVGIGILCLVRGDRMKKKLAKMAILLVRAKFQIVQNSDHKDECDLLQENLVDGLKPLTEVEPMAIPCWQLMWGANGARGSSWVKSYRDNRGVGLTYGFLRSIRRNRLPSSKATAQRYSCLRAVCLALHIISIHSLFTCHQAMPFPAWGYSSSYNSIFIQAYWIYVL